MSLPSHWKIAVGTLLLGLLFFSVEAQAAIDNSDVLDNVLARYSAAASTWAATITARASWLFWTLTLISMVWTFGMLALRKADIGEFYAEFARFTIFTGFFWWLLTNGPTFATDIMNSLRTIGGTASGTGAALSPSGIVDIGFNIFFKVLDYSSVSRPVDSAAGILISAAILIILALIGVNMLLLLVSGWILAYAGVFFLGFGGSRWTSDMAIHYYKTVLGIAAQLLTMVLLVGIGKSFVDQYYVNMSAGISLKELSVMLIVAVVLLALVNKVPALIGGLAMHGGTHALGGGFGTGAAMGAAAMAGAAVATGGAAIAAGAANAAGGVQALMTAASKASQNVAGGTDIVSRMAGGMADAVGGGGASGSAAGIGSPLASAMDGPAMSGSPSSGATSGGSRASSSSKGNSSQGQHDRQQQSQGCRADTRSAAARRREICSGYGRPGRHRRSRQPGQRQLGRRQGESQCRRRSCAGTPQPDHRRQSGRGHQGPGDDRHIQRAAQAGTHVRRQQPVRGQRHVGGR
jgi:type IV secretion system protein TrbL